MAVVVYIHGFLSSPLSRKAQQSQAWFKKYYPEVKFICPQLSSYPAEAKKTLEDMMREFSGQSIYAIGSSLGGFWSTWLVETGKVKKAVLVNPAVAPHTRFPEFLGTELKSYYSEEIYTLTQKDIDELAHLDCTVTHKTHYWVMLQKGDETLDYSLAVDKYQGCRQLVEEGGSHTFEGFKNWLPEIAAFFFH